MKIVIGIFIEITLKSVDHLGNLNISTILILASQEYGLYCHLFLFNFFHQYLINNSLQRKSAIFHLLWFNALLKPLQEMGILSSLASSLRVCGNTAGCPVHESYPWSLLHSFISSNRFWGHVCVPDLLSVSETSTDEVMCCLEGEVCGQR